MPSVQHQPRGAIGRAAIKPGAGGANLDQSVARAGPARRQRNADAGSMLLLRDEVYRLEGADGPLPVWVPTRGGKA